MLPRRGHFFAAQSAKKRRILIVEDEPGIALGLEDDLKMEGYEVEVLADGNAACRRALEYTFDLILLDVMLPGKDGFDVCRELRRRGMRSPILMLTAKAQEAEKVMGLELGADDYVTKPFGTLNSAPESEPCCAAATAGQRAAPTRSTVWKSISSAGNSATADKPWS